MNGIGVKGRHEFMRAHCRITYKDRIQTNLALRRSTHMNICEAMNAIDKGFVLNSVKDLGFGISPDYNVEMTLENIRNALPEGSELIVDRIEYEEGELEEKLARIEFEKKAWEWHSTLTDEQQEYLIFVCPVKGPMA